MNPPNLFEETIGIIRMKNKDFVFYAISALILALFVAIPVAAELSTGDGSPALAFFQEWIKSGEEFVFRTN